jgi:hypothetical protein
MSLGASGNLDSKHVDVRNMDTKHRTMDTERAPTTSALVTASSSSQTAGAAGAAGLIAPPALEYMLLHKSGQSMAGRKGVAEADSKGGVRSGGGGGSVGGADGSAVGYLSKWGNTIAVGDLQGQTAPEPDWYHPIQFVCMHCLQPAIGLAVGNPVGAEMAADTGITTWIVRGRFGSVSCAMRYASDHRLTLEQESAGLLPKMLICVYGFRGDLTDIPIAPARTALPPFQPEAVQRWRRGEIQFDGLSFHAELNRNIVLTNPDPNKHLILSDHCAVLVDAQLPRDRLPFNAEQLRRALPNLHTKPRTNHHQQPTPRS